MKVYHGGLSNVKVPEIRLGKNIGDFGIGFYVTTSLDQARRFVKTKGRRENVTLGFVSCYELDERLFASGFKGLSFAEPTLEWAKFVCANRKRPSFSHDYDYVRGPVANDQVYASFSFFEGGLISFDMLVEQLCVRELADQILLHTEQSLKMLKYVGSEVVSWER